MSYIPRGVFPPSPGRPDPPTPSCDDDRSMNADRVSPCIESYARCTARRCMIPAPSRLVARWELGTLIAAASRSTSSPLA